MKFLQDYKGAIDKNGILVRLDDFSDVVSTFCHNQVETVEQIQRNIEAEKKQEELKKAWEKDIPKLCSNIVTDFSDPEKYPHNTDEYQKLCDAFNRFTRAADKKIVR